MHAAAAGNVLVTGGTGALGAAVVAELLGAGLSVVATWIVEEERQRLEAELGDAGELRLLEADLSSTEGATAAAERAASERGLSGLVCLVGGFAAGGRLHEAPEGEFERMVELNLMTAQRTCRAALPLMLEGGGSIVLVGARAAVQPFAGAAGYVASKAGVIGLTAALAEDYRDDGVRANAILPSVIDTPANRASMPDADHASWVEPAEIAAVVRFLLSPDSSPTSGAAVPVYGRA